MPIYTHLQALAIQLQKRHDTDARLKLTMARNKATWVIDMFLLERKYQHIYKLFQEHN
jgi:hypothetical protein